MGPPTMHRTTHSLTEMLMNILSVDRDQFISLGEVSVYMPLRMMEKYLYPTIRLMQLLHD
jgi:hypothetical protein